MFCRKRVVEAVFLSVLDYGDVVYRHAAASTLKPLDSVYHSAIRFITGDSYDTHHCILYDRVGWSSLAERRKLHWHLFLYKAIIGDCPNYITSLLEWTSGPYRTRSNDRLTLKVPRIFTEFGESAFSYCGPDSWNNLQDSLKLNSLVSMNHFRTLVTNQVNKTCNCY